MKWELAAKKGYGIMKSALIKTSPNVKCPSLSVTKVASCELRVLMVVELRVVFNPSFELLGLVSDASCLSFFPMTYKLNAVLKIVCLTFLEDNFFRPYYCCLWFDDICLFTYKYRILKV